MSNMIEIGNLLGTTESAEADSGATTVEITMVEAFGDTMYSTQGGNEPGLKRCDCEGTEEETLDVRPPADQTDVPAPPLHPQHLLPQPLLPQPLLPQPLLPQPLLPQPLLPQPLLPQPLLPKPLLSQPLLSQPLLSQPLLSQPLLSQPQRITVPEEKTHFPQVQAAVVLQPQWAVGEPCQAVWSEDGNIYAATILKLEGERCRVLFDSYGNEDEVDVSSLKPREAKITQVETQARGSQAETQARGSQAETQARGSQAETQARGSQAETQARGSQAETQARGSQAETQARGSQAETQARGSQAETQARGSQAETQGSQAETQDRGSQAETQARGSQAETQARGSQAETQARGSQAETQSRGSQAETQARGSQAETQARSSQEWTVGSRCRATYALDGLSYPAVVLEVRGQRCRVRFDNYNNEEEVEVSSLLSFDELNGPSRSGRATAPWKSAFGTTARRRREALEDGDKREPERVERDRVDRSERGRDRNRKDPQLGPKLPRDRSRAPSREDERKSAESMAYSVFSCPPFPPPLHSSGDWWTSMPPPPLPSFLPGSSDAGPVPESLSHMLMMWYMCGFHTGSYLTLQQLKSPPRDLHKTGPF
ncbi:unnamed protein product [Knipowitschia caucasica]|uniref:Tudor domain-containing protein n=1 Tax=Knipowitschia caucasica TaxID=637954 RepID=A0AAV2KSU1_KNICA